MLRTLCLLSAVSVLACPASGAVRTDKHVTWGKAGVPIEQYVRDGAECANGSRDVAVSIKPDTLKALAARSSAQMISIGTSLPHSADTDLIGYFGAMDSFRSEADIARRSNTFGGANEAIVRTDVVGELQEALDRCLLERGYVKIGLTTGQARQLDHLKLHTPERTRYLYALGSDADIIERQRLDRDGTR